MAEADSRTFEVSAFSFHSYKYLVFLFVLIIGGNTLSITLSVVIGFNAWITVVGFIIFFITPLLFFTRLRSLFLYKVTIRFTDGKMIVERGEIKSGRLFKSETFKVGDIGTYYLYGTEAKNTTLFRTNFTNMEKPFTITLVGKDLVTGQKLSEQISDTFSNLENQHIVQEGSNAALTKMKSLAGVLVLVLMLILLLLVVSKR